MTIEVAPNRIEQSDFTLGFAPDGEEAGLPASASPDMLNLLPDPSTGVPELRKGFARLHRISSLTTHWIRHVNYYEYMSGGNRYRNLVCVLSNGGSSANNVQVWLYKFSDDSLTRIDTVGRTWTKPKAEHWFAIIQGVYYGGVRNDAIYSYDGATATWDASPTTPNVRTWVDGIDASINTDTQYGRDFAFKKGTKVKYGSKWYSSLHDIRYEAWESGQRYGKGDRVSIHRAWGHSGSANYWKSWECVKGHTADATNRPGDGTGSPGDYWKKVHLQTILNDDGDINDGNWVFLPIAAKSSVGVFHADRLFVRRDDEDDWARTQYSAPLRPEKDQEIADLTFDPTDWAPVDDLDGEGGGWFMSYGNEGDAIRAYQSYGNYLIIAKRWESYVLIGRDDRTWEHRRLGDYGAISSQAITEHEGLIYILSPTGALVRTDGTAMQEVPGMDRVREWVKLRLDHLLVGEDDRNWQPTIASYGPFVIVSLPGNPDASDYPLSPINATLFYHVDMQSFWVTDLPVLDATVGASQRAQRLYFVPPNSGAVGGNPVIHQLADDPGNEVYDDDSLIPTTSTNPHTAITWRWRTAWFKFGVTRVERRLRRAWAILKGAASTSVTVKVFRNYEESSAATSTANTLVDGDMAEYVEGLVAMNAAYSLGMEVSGTASAEVALHGFGLDTEPVRTRFHRG